MTVKRERIRYTAEQKQAVVARMMPPQNEAVGKIHEETKITEATLYKWRKEARAWALKFIRWYNEVHLHSALKFVTPVQCHMGEHIDILEKRKEVYEEASRALGKANTELVSARTSGTESDESSR
ncbi:MAG: transposase [Solibacillus sp.]